MSQNTNKLFWISAIVIVFTAIGFMVYNNVGKPSNNLYNNANSETLCNSFYKEGLVTCLDASSNSSLGQHINNESENKDIWYAQNKTNDASLHNFDFDDNSGWNETSLLFDGINDNLETAININNDKFSLLLNINLLQLPDTQAMLINNANFKVYLNNNGVLKVILNNIELESNQLLTTDTWHSITVVYNNDLLKLYVNGQLDNSISANLGMINISNKIIVGDKINMKLSSYAIWNNELTSNEINQNTIAINNKTLDIDRYIVDFDYSGNCEEWYAPYTGEYQIELWGASGGSFNSFQGGNGAYTSGNINLPENQLLYICVGEQGNDKGESFNGTIKTDYKYAGGGATDVRLNYGTKWNSFNSLKTRIMVAGAGGTGITANGGNGGITNGQNAFGNFTGIINAIGGKQKVPGINSSIKNGFKSSQLTEYLANNNKPGFGFSVNAGGSGYFGGGGTGIKGAGAGGSSYVSGYKDNISLHNTATEHNLVFSGNIHYSGYEFTSPKIESGSTQIIDPITKESSIGKKGNGYARITLIKILDNVENKEPVEEYLEVPDKVIPTVSLTKENSVTITWEDSNNAQKYECFYSLDNNDYIKGNVITPLGQQQYCVFNDLTQNTEYSYKVIAYNGDKSSESDVKTFKTDNHTPIKPTLSTYEMTDTTIDIEFNTDTIFTSYMCYVGETKDIQDNLVNSIASDNKIQCHIDNLTQNKNYYIRLDVINNDKKVSSDVIEIITNYEQPEPVVLDNYETTLNSIEAHFSGLKNYTDIKCYIGNDSTDIVTEIDKETFSDGVTCKATNLEEGHNYYLKTIVFNDTKSSDSDIYTIKTKYQKPVKPIKTSSTITEKSIIDIYEDNDNNLSDVRYICSYGTDIDNLDFAGTLIESLDGEKRCEYNNLAENTTYYTRMTIRNGTEYVDSDINIIKTDYIKPSKPIYTASYLYDNNNIYAKYDIENPNHIYKCYISLGDFRNEGEATVDKDNKYLECRFTNLSGGEYSFYSIVENGHYTVESDTHSLSMNVIVPSLSVTVDNSQLNSAGWANKNIEFDVKASTIVQNQITGLAYCIDSSNCEPNVNTIQDRLSVEHTSADNKTIVKTDFKDSAKIYMTDETNVGNKICFKILYGTNETTKQCYGPYKLDKTKPTITGNDVTIADTVTTYDIYSGLTIKDNYTATDKITKKYDTAPTWGDSGTYYVTYTVTDAAGNSQTLKRKFTITLTTFNISYTLNSGSVSGNPTTYNKKTNTFTLKNPTRTGYTFLGWSGTGISGNSTSVTVSKGSTGNRSYTANWQGNNHTANYYGLGDGWWTSSTVKTGDTVPNPGNPPGNEQWYFTGWRSYVGGAMPNSDINVYSNWAQHTCRVTFGSAGSSNSQAQYNKLVGNFPISGKCSVGNDLACDGLAYSDAIDLFNRAWNYLPTSGSGFSRYKDIGCTSGWANWSNR
jgi:uncharacterized repeat protein (TIGR02543 family)